MRYKCENCGVEERRGYFPRRFFHIRYALFHGIALGVSSIIVTTLFERIGRDPHGFATLTACLVLMLVFYGSAVFVESCVVAARGCTGCQSHSLHIMK
jgi:hypothetical protein